MRIVLTKELEDFWGTEEELNSMNDEELIEFLKEDLSALLEDAEWQIIR